MVLRPRRPSCEVGQVGASSPPCSQSFFDAKRHHNAGRVLARQIYGDIRWEDEKARLDNFVIQLFNQPNYTGYIYIQVGRNSCSGEAFARAIRARNYLMKVRHFPWNRLAWRDLGYGDHFEVTLWLFPSGAPPRYLPDYQAPTTDHIVEACSSPLKRPKSRASNNGTLHKAHGRLQQLYNKSLGHAGCKKIVVCEEMRRRLSRERAVDVSCESHST